VTQRRKAFHTKNQIRRILTEKMEKQIMHGQYIRSIDRQLINEENTILRLSRGYLKDDTK
jgi:hypothetical protein